MTTSVRCVLDPELRGESRFTTWACKSVILEVSSKLGRHFRRTPLAALDAGGHLSLSE